MVDCQMVALVVVTETPSSKELSCGIKGRVELERRLGSGTVLRFNSAHCGTKQTAPKVPFKIHVKGPITENKRQNSLIHRIPRK